MSEPRKASDIILSLEAEILSLKSNINHFDKMLKLIVAQSNKTNQLVSVLLDSQELSEDMLNRVNEILEVNGDNKKMLISGGKKIDVATEFKGQRLLTGSAQPMPKEPGKTNKATNADVDFKDYMAQRNKPEAKQPALNKGPLAPTADEFNTSDKKIPVVQRVQDTNKKDLFMAEVNVFSSGGEHIMKTKTNALGKWQGQLPPGKYMVKVSKMDAASKQKFESELDILVPNSNTTVNLSTIFINRG